MMSDQKVPPAYVRDIIQSDHLTQNDRVSPGAGEACALELAVNKERFRCADLVHQLQGKCTRPEIIMMLKQLEIDILRGHDAAS